MDNKEKVKVAITAGIVAVILLLLIAYIAISGKAVDKNKEDELLASNIMEYANSGASDDQSTSSVSTGVSLEAASSDSADNASTESSSDNADSSASSSTSTEKNEKVKKEPGKCFYRADAAELKDKYGKVKYDRDAQLKEMHDYWAKNNMEAVRELAHLERYEAMSYSLNGSYDFYYYGDKNDDGKPEGKGLAVYANDQYYFGEFKDGKRSGSGSWICFYPSYSGNVVTEHTYSGEWAEDRPNGKGQEHYDYDSGRMNTSDIYIQNAIGYFKDSYYDKEMYIITVDKTGHTDEWTGTCKEGKFDAAAHASKDSTGRIPVMSLKGNDDTHLYMTDKEIEENLIRGIITGGNAAN
ncbi:hypothetical protein D6853_04560 [Butyrivibrio sp. X503]|uniref:hypothetical protein n=1 Tax=Butyrivibrio sp. X503 TaxID=2364878 RepID=UPI000EA8DA66|nr:hypothetical protein [Butyrivibrio sp. X503]RKM57290.1 hypothetical protein D6853_04560 [Butyrivibrio sp. X503]